MTDIVYQVGSSGAGVTALQEYLNRYGFKDNSGNSLKVDGQYQELTKEAVMNFQTVAQKLGLYKYKVDGVYGHYTQVAAAKYGSTHTAGSGTTTTTPSNDGWYTVPHVVAYTQDNGVNCGPTAWSMGLASEFGVYISQDKLASLMDTGANGTDPSAAIAEMEKLGYKAYFKTWSKEGLNQLAKDVADPNVIVVLLVMTGPLKYDASGNLIWQGNYGHYEYPVAVNVSQGLIKLQDPRKNLHTWKASAVENAMAAHSGNSVFITSKS